MGLFLYFVMAFVVAFALNIVIRVIQTSDLDNVDQAFLMFISCVIGAMWPVSLSLTAIGGTLYFLLLKSNSLVNYLKRKFNLEEY